MRDMHCAYFDANLCRSCTELPIARDDQLRDKQGRARALLSSHSTLEWLPTFAGRESGFRNKAKLVVGGTRELPILGIRDVHGKAVDLSDCALYPEAMRRWFPQLQAFVRDAGLAPYDVEARSGELKFLLVTIAEHSGLLMLRIVLRSQDSVARIRKHLPALMQSIPALAVVSVNLLPEHKAVTEGAREILLTDVGELDMRVNNRTIRLRPQSFFQTNIEVAAALYTQARDWVADADPASVWDLYSGAGGFALHVADGKRDVLGVESNQAAVDSARRSTAAAGFERLDFEAADVATFVRNARASPHCVIVNPPRRGIGAELCELLEHADVRTILYSSCNVDTLAQDLARMPSMIARRARIFDMFPHTRHFETLVMLERAH